MTMSSSVEQKDAERVVRPRKQKCYLRHLLEDLTHGIWQNVDRCVPFFSFLALLILRAFRLFVLLRTCPISLKVSARKAIQVT